MGRIEGSDAAGVAMDPCPAAWSSQLQVKAAREIRIDPIDFLANPVEVFMGLVSTVLEFKSN